VLPVPRLCLATLRGTQSDESLRAASAAGTCQAGSLRESKACDAEVLGQVRMLKAQCGPAGIMPRVSRTGDGDRRLLARAAKRSDFARNRQTPENLT
jgi:hypothetical protein